MQQSGDRTADAASAVRVVRQAARHQQAAEVRVAEAQRAEFVAIGRDALRRVAGVVDQDFLSDEEQPASVAEPFDVERAVGLAALHQVDARQVAGRVVEEHVLAARIAAVDPAGVRAGVPLVDRGVVLHARIAALPSVGGHLVHQVASLVRRAGDLGIGHPMRGPRAVGGTGLHELVGDAHREVCVLEHHRAVGFAVEVGVVTGGDERAGLLLFLRLALDEFENVRVPDLQRLHLGRATRLAAALHHGRDLIVDPHEREGAGRLAAAGELFAFRAERREVGAGAGAELEEHGLAAREFHDVFHVVFNALDEAGRALRIFVRVFRNADLFGFLVPVPVAGRALHSVLVEEADIEPHGRIEGAVLVEAEPGEVAVETLAVFIRGEVAVFDAPIRDGARDAVDQLLDAVFALRRIDFAVVVFAANDVRGQLRPEHRHFAIGLLEEHFAVFALDGGGTGFPLHGVERTGDVGRAKYRLDHQARGETTRRLLRGAFSHAGCTGFCHEETLEKGAVTRGIHTTA